MSDHQSIRVWQNVRKDFSVSGPAVSPFLVRAMAKPLRVGVVGLGAISKYWLHSINTNAQTTLTAVCDVRKPSDLTRFGSTTFFQDFNELVRDPNVDCVVVDTPPNSHKDIISAALRAGKSVITEKPICITLEDGETCVNLANELKVPLYLAWHSAFGGAALRCKEAMRPFLDKGDKIVSFSVDAHLYVPNYHRDKIVSFSVDAHLYVPNYHPDGASWIFDPKVSGGGCLIDSAINAISIVVSNVGPIKPLKVRLDFPAGQRVESVVDATFEGINDASVNGTMRFDWLSKQPERGLYTFNFASGVKVNFEIVSGQIHVVENGKETAIQSNNRDASVDSTQIPMSMEYDNLFKDALKFLHSNVGQDGSYINQGGFSPFWTTMTMYKMAERVNL